MKLISQLKYAAFLDFSELLIVHISRVFVRFYFSYLYTFHLVFSSFLYFLPFFFSSDIPRFLPKKSLRFSSLRRGVP